MGWGIRGHLSRLAAREPWWAEFWSAATGALWAGFTYACMERLDAWPAMRVIASIGDDRFWHLLGFGLSFGQMIALAANLRWLRGASALAMAWFWAVLTIGVWLAAPWSLAVAVQAGWCAINVFSVLRTLLPSRPDQGLAGSS